MWHKFLHDFQEDEDRGENPQDFFTIIKDLIRNLVQIKVDLLSIYKELS